MRNQSVPSIDADDGHQATTYQPDASDQIEFKNNLWFGAQIQSKGNRAAIKRALPNSPIGGGVLRKDYQPAKGSAASKGNFGARQECFNSIKSMIQ